MEKYLVSALVVNHYGVLARVSSLFGRRGFNIHSLTVSPTLDESISRITMVVVGDEYTLEQVLKQMRKLEECRSVVHVEEDKAYARELVLVKIKADEATKEKIRQQCTFYDAAVLGGTENTIVVRKNGTPSDVNKFLDVIKNYEIITSSRTGVTALSKDEKEI